MRLAEFIPQNMESILENWEEFAATRLPAAGLMAPVELRDHAKEILQAVVADLRTPQTLQAQAAKSQGLAPVMFPAPETAAQTHAVLRAKSGFDIAQLAAEYRALRASVLMLWLADCKPGDASVDEVIRFNEAIDQALAESIVFFSARVEQSRNLLLGMLSHDLRSPLQTIQSTAQYLRALDVQPEVSRAAARLIKSGARMQSLLNDLLDVNRSKLGLGLRVTLRETDLADVCADEIDAIRAGRPGQSVELEVTGDCHGCWDEGRIRQLLGNLVINALDHGTPGEVVRVKVLGNPMNVRLEVTNATSIDQRAISELFDPLTAGPYTETNVAGLGLGLFIVREVARAHGGRIDVSSEASVTTFSVLLPRRYQDGDASDA